MAGMNYHQHQGGMPFEAFGGGPMSSGQSYPYVEYHENAFPPGPNYHQRGVYYQEPPPIPQQYYYGNPGRGRGNGNFNPRGRGRGQKTHMKSQNQQYYENTGYYQPTGDPNLDFENKYSPRSDLYSAQKSRTTRGQRVRGRGSGGGQREIYRNQQGAMASNGNRNSHGNFGMGPVETIFDSPCEGSAPDEARTSGRGGQASGRNSNTAVHSGQNSSKRGQGRGKQIRIPKVNNQEDAETQRDIMIEQLSNNTYECMVCCDCVRRDAAIWNCSKCYHVFHLHCLKRWAKSSTAVTEGDAAGWRCPACQNVTEQFPSQYRCYCGKVRDPQTSSYDVPHGCGEVCGRKRPFNCAHPCNILCHPGPCPPCLASVTKHCDCGKTKQTVKCGQANVIKCTSKCQKTLNCGKHECQRVCHTASCDPCEDQITQKCYCSKEERNVTCGTSEAFNKSFSCKGKCDSKLDCGNHVCKRHCHPGACDTCQLLPSAVTHCPCGKVSLAGLQATDVARTKCTDSIPTCDSTCGKLLKCGPKEKPHACEKICHEGECGACSGTAEHTCRCGRFTTDLSCQEAAKFTEGDPFTCDRRCHKKRQCGKHKCGQLCCMDTEHACDQVCGRKLTCGLHRCEERCHRTNCPTCWHVSFEELRCHCGLEVMYPPIPCGTKAPECHRPCSRDHPCGHQARHNCHSDERCPPCTELTKKWCMGRHEIRKNIPCHLVDISCGLPCGKQLGCGVHKCQLVCHKGPCMAEGACTQPCPRPRAQCDHPCGSPCHGPAPCPSVTCKADVVIKCDCGNRTERSQCLLGGTADFLKMDSGMLAMAQSNTMDGQGLDFSAMMTEANSKRQRKLECTQACSLLERNKRLALALEIKNPDVSSKLGSPSYTQFLRDYAKQYTTFVASIEQDLSTLVKTAEKSKQIKRSHAFKSMNSNQRRVVHELAEFYGCESQSYDEPPNKNVVATAYRGKCFHPSISLTKSVQRETQSKAPTPIPHHGNEQDIRSNVVAANKSTAVLGAWGKLRPTPTNQPPAPSKPAPWANHSAAQKPGALGTTNQTASGLKLKSMSVLKKDTDDKKSSKKKHGRNSPMSPVIDYFDIDYFDVTG